MQRKLAYLLMLLASLSQAQVRTVFGRTGDVTANVGDYKAADVTNAVDSTQSYVNPKWLQSLDWSKITNAPIISLGNGNLASGQSALQNNSTGTSDLAVGDYALNSNTTGCCNIGVGHASLYSNTTGSQNTAIGDGALSANQGGDWNTVFGANAGMSINGVDSPPGNPVLGFGNTAVGKDSLLTDVTGNQNTAVGHRALFHATGSYNTAVGADSQVYNSSGSFNTTLGHDAMVGASGSCTDGFASYSGSYNTAVGQSSFCTVTTGSNNTLLGWMSGFLMTSGSNNVVIGYQAGTTNNQANANLSGSNNTFVGYQSGPGVSTAINNAAAIGTNAVVSESDAMVLGGTGQYAVRVGIGTSTPSNVFTIGQGSGIAISDGWATYSSARWKTNIQTLNGALGKIQQLRGVSYDLKGTSKHEIGLIAEEVGRIVPEVVTWSKDGKKAEGVDYSRLTAVLIEATKEQQQLIEEQKRSIRNQSVQIARLASQIKEVQAARAAAEMAPAKGTQPRLSSQSTIEKLNRGKDNAARAETISMQEQGKN